MARIRERCEWAPKGWRKVDDRYVLQWFARDDPSIGVQTPRPNRHVVGYAVGSDRYEDHVEIHEAAGWLKLDEALIRNDIRKVMWQSPRMAALRSGEAPSKDSLVPPSIPNDPPAVGGELPQLDFELHPVEQAPVGAQTPYVAYDHARPPEERSTKTSLFWFSDDDGGFFDMPF